MGAWGSDIFQDDTALDFVGDLAHSLVQMLHDHLGASRFLEDRIIGPDVSAALACLRALALGIDSTRTCLSRSEVDLWRDNYLKWFDKHGAIEWRTAEDAAEYRQNVEREFQQLMAVSIEQPKDEWDQTIADRDRRPANWPGK